MAEIPRKGFGAAAEARRKLGTSAPSYSELDAKARGVAVLRRIPQRLDHVPSFAESLLDVIWEIAPTRLDDQPEIETAYGKLPLVETTRADLLVKLDEQRTGTPGDPDTLLMVAADVLHQHLRILEQHWHDRTVRVHQVLHEVEGIGRELAHHFLVTNRAMAVIEAKRYLATNAGLSYVVAGNPEYLSVQAAARRIRRQLPADIDAVKREGLVVNVLSTAVTVATVLQAANSGGLSAAVADGFELRLDAQSWAVIREVEQWRSQADEHVTEKLAAYLTVLLREAEAHPLLLLAHEKLAHGATAAQAGAIIRGALETNAKAFSRLRAGILEPVIADPATTGRTVRDITVAGLFRQISRSPEKSIWKLPFFVTRAIQELGSDDALIASRALQAAAELDSSDALRRGLMLGALDTAMALAGVAGPVGVAVAFGYSVRSLLAEIAHYQQLRDLMAASVDPTLLLGDPTDGPSVAPVVFALFDLWV